MNANTMKLLAVAAVIVVVAGGAVGYLVVKKDKDDGVNIEAALEVYGNADNDYKIDSSDLDVINKIKNGDAGYTLDKYPLADANNDKTVDDKDVEIVKKIIAGEKTNIYVVNHTTDTTNYPNGTYAAKVTWPVTKCVANGAANALIVYEVVGIKDNIVGINYSSSSPPDSIIYSDYAKMPSLGDSTMYITGSLLADCLKENPETTLVLTADNKGYLDGTKGVSEKNIIEDYNLDVVRIEHAAVGGKEFSSALLMVGFLFQKDSKAQEVSEWIENVYRDMDAKLATVTKKTRVAATSYNTYLSTLNSDYAQVVVQAGGDYTIPAGTSTSMYFSGSKADPKIYSDEYQGDVIIALRTGSGFLKASWYDSPENYNVANMQKNLQSFKDFKAYENKQVWHISGDMPVVARVLYSAAILYPDLFPMDDADALHQEFVDKFLDGRYTVSELSFVLSQTQIEAMKATA